MNRFLDISQVQSDGLTQTRLHLLVQLQFCHEATQSLTQIDPVDQQMS